MLAASHDRPISRDRLIAYLWPDADAESGRHLLSGALYELRRALGESAILSRGDDVWLDPKAVQSDVAAFEAAIDAQDFLAAVGLYRGDFADGFHVGRAPDFERWLESARERLRRRFHEALEKSAVALANAGNARAAADHWLRLAAADPSDARVLLQAMRALDASGNRAAALRQAAVYETFMRVEFGAVAAPEVTALVDELRQSEEPPQRPSLLAVKEPAPDALPASTNGFPTRPRTWIAFAVAAVVMFALGIGIARRSVAADRSEARSPLVVHPFSVRGGTPSIEPVDLSLAVATALEGIPDLNDRSVNGSLHEAGGRLRALVTLQDASGRVLGNATVEGPAARPFELVDAIALELLAVHWSAPSQRLQRAVARSTKSLAAVRAYLVGESERRSGRFAAAAESFARAVAADSAFALGYYRLSMTTLAADLPMAAAAAADERAERHSGGLSEPERLLLRGYLAFRRGDAEIAEQLYEGLLGTFPDDIEVSRQLGETLFHYNPLRGRSISEARSAFERVLRAEPADWDALLHLAQIAASEGRRNEAVAGFDALLRLRPAPAQLLELRALRALAARSRPAEDALLPELKRADELVLHQIVWRVSVYLGDLAGAERIARLMVSPDRPLYARSTGHQNLAALHLARGQWAAGIRALRDAGTVYPEFRPQALLYHALYAAVLARPPAELREVRDSLATSRLLDGPLNARRLTMLALLDVRLTDTAAAHSRIAALERAGERSGAAMMRGLLAQARGNAGEAAGELARTMPVRWFGHALTNIHNSGALERFLYAEALREAGRLQEALGWYAAFADHAPHDLAFLPASLLRRAQVYEALGESRRAAEHYAQLVDLLEQCDPDLIPVRENARQRSRRIAS